MPTHRWRVQLTFAFFFAVGLNVVETMYDTPIKVTGIKGNASALQVGAIRFVPRQSRMRSWRLSAPAN